MFQTLKRPNGRTPRMSHDEERVKRREFGHPHHRGSPLRKGGPQVHPAAANLTGTASCGPACQVVWKREGNPHGDPKKRTVKTIDSTPRYAPMHVSLLGNDHTLHWTFLCTRWNMRLVWSIIE